ncbi:MAG: oxidoreductase [Actinomycetota bacterium]|nr:MAG: oxidoreductase [Actinomycetota bacterium]
MRLFSRRSRGGASLDRAATREDVDHLDRFARSRRGVEAYVEPQTATTQTTLVLIAYDGEWTRRRVDGPQEARRLAERWGVPCYEAAVVGYPQRMREWNSRQR